jgi:hypothetical protein
MRRVCEIVVLGLCVSVLGCKKKAEDKPKVPAQAEAITMESFEAKAASYLNGAAEVAEAESADCKAQKNKLDAYVKSHTGDLQTLQSMTTSLREKGKSLNKATLDVMFKESEGSARRANDRFLAAFKEECKLNKISVLISFHVSLKSPEELSEIHNKIEDINKDINKFNVARREAEKMPPLVAIVPEKPGPMGLFGPVKFGMTMEEAHKAQPGIVLGSFGSSGGGHAGPESELQVTGVGYKFHDKSLIAPNAFPWVWPKNPEYYVGDVLNINAYVRFEGFERKDAKDPQKAKADWRVESMKIDFRDFKGTYDVVLAGLTTRWGAPSTLTIKRFDEPTQVHLWSNAEEGVCVVLRDRSQTFHINYNMNIRPCWTVEKAVHTLTAPAGQPGALLGSTLDQLKTRFGAASISHNNGSFTIYAPPWFLDTADARAEIAIDLNDKGVVIAARAELEQKNLLQVR